MKLAGLLKRLRAEAAQAPDGDITQPPAKRQKRPQNETDKTESESFNMSQVETQKVELQQPSQTELPATPAYSTHEHTAAASIAQKESPQHEPTSAIQLLLHRLQSGAITEEMAKHLLEQLSGNEESKSVNAQSHSAPITQLQAPQSEHTQQDPTQQQLSTQQQQLPQLQSQQQDQQQEQQQTQLQPQIEPEPQPQQQQAPPQESHQDSSQPQVPTQQPQDAQPSTSEVPLEPAVSDNHVEVQPDKVAAATPIDLPDADDQMKTENPSANQEIEVSNEQIVSVRTIEYDFNIEASKLLFIAQEEYNHISKFLKGAKWSPDGTRFLTTCEDAVMRLYHLPSDYGQEAQKPISPVLEVRESEMIYDYCWYPHSYMSVPGSSVFISTSRDQPIHMWDAETGNLRATYRAYNAADEITSAFSVAFSADGSKIYAGYNSVIRVFDLTVPGRAYTEYTTVPYKDVRKGRTRDVPHQYAMKGILSCIAVNAVSNILAAGSYNAKIGIYADNQLQPVTTLRGHRNGITHLKFSPDGNYLYSGTRRDQYIFCWDMRNTKEPVRRFERIVTTNQRIYFDLDPSGTYLATGSQNGEVLIFNTSDANASISRFVAHNDAVNGCQFHPYLPLLLTSSGQRKFVVEGDDSSESSDDEADVNISTQHFDNSVKVWRL